MPRRLADSLPSGTMGTDVPTHRGVAAEDTRNAGVIAFFRPPEVTTA